MSLSVVGKGRPDFSPNELRPWVLLSRWLRNWLVNTIVGFAWIAWFIAARAFVHLRGYNRYIRLRRFARVFVANYRAAAFPIPITAAINTGVPPSFPDISRRGRLKIAWAFAWSDLKGPVTKPPNSVVAEGRYWR